MSTNIKYREFKSTDKSIVSELIKELYKEVSGKSKISNENINKTFSEFLHNSKGGRILILEKEKQIIGYCLLVNYWSNEFGGNVVNIDEIYIKPKFRGKNTGTDFISNLIRNKFMKAVAFQLEVKPSSNKVIEIYKRIGFKHSKNSHLIYY